MSASNTTISMIVNKNNKAGCSFSANNFVLAKMDSFSIDDIANCTNCIITYILNGASTKLPLKEKDMTNTINVKGKSFTMAFNHAKAALKETYGLLVVEVPDSKSGKAYICYSEENVNTLLLLDEDQQRHLALLFIILSYLFMRGSDTLNQTKTTEEELLQFLNSIRIRVDECHSYFGPNLKKLITETFVKQLYLKREKVVSELDVETKFYYYWGFRASVEFDKKLLLEASAKILKKPSTFFVSKYQDVYGSDVEMMKSEN